MTRHAAIRQQIEGLILSGALKPGDRLPSEQELVAAHGVARMTVSRALADLVAAGLVVRRRKAGSFVAAPPSEEKLLGVPDMREMLPGHSHAVLKRAVRVASAADRARLGVVPKGARVLALLVRHDSEGRAAALEDRLISLEAVPEAAEEPFAALPPGTWLLHRVPWTEAEHRIRAAGADAVVASTLGMGLEEACLVMERRTWRGDQPVTAARITWPGDRHAVTVRSVRGPLRG
ncbi:UTRA domain-containing protein [Roseomonas stagni]|uniref:UTRA domain-containing protein n=1 Tax=Falsiroseomonas algicola TaxID=2716930 RepID=A0A6M1LFP2_9PROT|nr:UTRA domain-containing protein [Falsiroseomonas algicola]NGM18962.1 UTRA domain-containing protein [Falsiroseomonas algicola]